MDRDRQRILQIPADLTSFQERTLAVGFGIHISQALYGNDTDLRERHKREILRENQDLNPQSTASALFFRLHAPGVRAGGHYALQPMVGGLAIYPLKAARSKSR